MRRINEAGLDLVKQFEGFEPVAYLCPAQVWTIGYGHTGNVRSGDVVSEQEAETLLEFDTQAAANTVSNAVKVDLTENQFSALVSLVFNIGAGAFRDSTLLRVLNEGRYPEVPAQFRRWCKAKGKILPGLLNRRNAEVELWLKEGE